MTKTLRKDAFEFGGHGRGMMNKMTREAKGRMNRIIHKRRRRKNKQEAKNGNNI